MWDGLLEARIRLHKSLVLSNRLPQYDSLDSFKESGKEAVRDSLKKSEFAICSHVLFLPNTGHTSNVYIPKTTVHVYRNTCRYRNGKTYPCDCFVVLIAGSFLCLKPYSIL